MANLNRNNVEFVSEVSGFRRKSYELADPTLGNPNNTNAIIDGEILTLDDNEKLVRAVDIAAADNVATKIGFVVWNEKGRTDTQVLNQKVIIWMHAHEFNTTIFDATATAGTAGAVITKVLQPVKAASITIDGKIYSGIVGHGGAADSDPILGYVTSLPANNNGKLRVRID